MNGIPKRVARDAWERDRLRGLWDKQQKKHRKQMWCEKPSAKDYFTICYLLSVLTLNHSCLFPISHYQFFYHVLFGNFSSVPECLLHISWVFKLLWGIWGESEQLNSVLNYQNPFWSSTHSLKGSLNEQKQLLVLLVTISWYIQRMGN